MNRRWIILIGLIFLGMVANAQGELDSTTELEAEAIATLWDNADYIGVIAGLEDYIAQMPYHAEAYMNLGNAYWQLGEKGHALYNWRRAQLIAPRYPNLNEQIYRAQIDISLEEATPESGIITVALASEVILNTDELLWMITGLWLLFWGTQWYTHRRKIEGLLYVTVFIVLFFFGLLTLLGSRLYVYESMTPAIILMNDVPVLNGADASYLTLFTLQEGQEIYRIEQNNDWIRIVTRNGREGWILRDNVGYIPILG